MSKTNFTKAEEALNEEMRKIAIQKILDETAAAKDDYSPSQKVIKQLIRDVNPLIKKDKRLFAKLGFKKEQIKAILEDQNISAENWKVLMDFKEKLDSYRMEKKKNSEGSEEKQVEEERIKHINKRFNINEGWLPLQ